MRLRVLFFGPLAELLGRREESLELPGAPQAGDVYAHYQAQREGLGQLGRDLLLAVNEEFSGPERVLREGDEIALLPPMSGGAPASLAVALTRTRIDAAAWRDRVAHPEHGAVVVFEGVVRNHHQGRKVEALDYEAYEPMARKRLEAIAAQVLRQWPIGAVALVHRLGRLQVGETSVLVAIGAAHRAPAFEAAAFAISAIKRSVPIWKKEWSPDGASWTEGEFPTPADTETDTGEEQAEPSSAAQR